MTPEDFVARWSQSTLREQQSAQSHFNELCQMLNQPTPTERDPLGTFFTFEQAVLKTDGRPGRADVWLAGHFAWEYKGKGRNLNDAYAQLLSYKTALGNPPLLVVCDFNEYRIYPQWPNVDAQPIVFHNVDLLKFEYRRFILWLLTAPEQFLRYKLNQEEQSRILTERLAEKFALLATYLETERPAGEPVWTQEEIARFLLRLMFVLFAESTGLLPDDRTGPVVSYLIYVALKDSANTFVPNMRDLFAAMNGEGRFLGRVIPYFNGGLFERTPDETGQYQVIDLIKYTEAVSLLREVQGIDWSKVNPTIFGTLFENALDPRKRGQLGAHYTGEADIRVILDPVIMEPLIAEWEIVRIEAELLMQTFLEKDTLPRPREDAHTRLIALHERMATRLSSFTVLDPACGSGNFLYLSLRLLKDLEGRIQDFFAPLRLPFRDWVSPRQFYGIEKEPFAARLAHVVVWIGYLQWRYINDGGLFPVVPSNRFHERVLPNPILGYGEGDKADRIMQADAIMRYDAAGRAYEPEWPPADVIVGNPPFLGGNRVRGELGMYVDDLFSLYADRVPAFADLVCYWFEKARAHIAAGKAKRAGLLSTNSIRGGVNRDVLQRIKESGDIFMAWGDREWLLAGAAVRTSMVGFDDGTQKTRTLDGSPVDVINADLTAAVDITKAAKLPENDNLCFMGASPKGSFDIDAELARTLLNSDNKSGLKNSDVVRPVVSAVDIVGEFRDEWTIDFGMMSLEQAKQYEAPFAYILEKVYPVRSQNRRASYAEQWWQYAEARPGMRMALKSLKRFIATPGVSKHRVFVWMTIETLCNQGTFVFAREDDYFFGVLHSALHEIWSLRTGTSLEDRPRYTPTTTFETFPLPYPPGAEETAAPAYIAISQAARALHEEREAWLYPAEFTALGGAKPRNRTLTALYNALDHLRGGTPFNGLHGNGKNGNGKNGNGSADDPAVRFAPRLRQLHDALDHAVLAAYGWDDPAADLRSPLGQDAVLSRLVALNVLRAAAQG